MCYRIVEEAKPALADINMYQEWKAEMYRSTSKEEQIRVNDDYTEEQNNAVEKVSKRKERMQIPIEIMLPLPQKKK